MNAHVLEVLNELGFEFVNDEPIQRALLALGTPEFWPIFDSLLEEIDNDIHPFTPPPKKASGLRRICFNNIPKNQLYEAYELTKNDLICATHHEAVRFERKMIQLVTSIYNQLNNIIDNGRIKHEMKRARVRNSEIEYFKQIITTHNKSLQELYQCLFDVFIRLEGFEINNLFDEYGTGELLLTLNLLYPIINFFDVFNFTRIVFLFLKELSKENFFNNTNVAQLKLISDNVKMIAESPEINTRVAKLRSYDRFIE